VRLTLASLAAATALTVRSSAQTLTRDRSIAPGAITFLPGSSAGNYGVRYAIEVFNATGAPQDMSVEVYVYVNDVLADADIVAIGGPVGGPTGGGVPSGDPAPGPNPIYPPGCGSSSCALPNCIPGGLGYVPVCETLSVPNNVGFSCVCLLEFTGDTWLGTSTGTGLPLSSGDRVRVEFVPLTGTIGEIDTSNDSAQATWYPPPVVYCTAKLTSNGCVPSIGAVGTPSATSGSGFVVNASNVINQKAGLFFYGGVPFAAPFQGGTLCVHPPLSRTPVLFSGGNPPPNDCSGVFSIDMNAFAIGSFGGGPSLLLLMPGSTIFIQAWGRDPGFAAPNNTILSDALQYTVGS
jgi:hypothetical protein